MNNRERKPNIAAIILIGMGILFLVTQVTGYSFFGTFWPLIIVLPGLALLGGAYYGEGKVSVLAFPGAFVMGTGLILFYQNLTGNWHTWAYIWTLYPGMFGLAMKYVGQREDQATLVSFGQMMIKGSLLGFVIFAGFFELLIFSGAGFGIATILIPVALIGAGLWLVTQRGTNGDKEKRKISELIG